MSTVFHCITVVWSFLSLAQLVLSRKSISFVKCLRRRWCAFLCLTGSNNGVTEYVRQELRAMVGARQQQVRILPSGQVSTDFEALGLSFEMPNQGKHSLVVLFLHSINLFLLSLFDNNVLICNLKLNFRSF